MSALTTITAITEILVLIQRLQQLQPMLVELIRKSQAGELSDADMLAQAAALDDEKRAALEAAIVAKTV